MVPAKSELFHPILFYFLYIFMYARNQAYKFFKSFNQFSHLSFVDSSTSYLKLVDLSTFLYLFNNLDKKETAFCNLFVLLLFSNYSSKVFLSSTKYDTFTCKSFFCKCSFNICYFIPIYSNTALFNCTSSFRF